MHAIIRKGSASFEQVDMTNISAAIDQNSVHTCKYIHKRNNNSMNSIRNVNISDIGQSVVNTIFESKFICAQCKSISHSATTAFTCHTYLWNK